MLISFLAALSSGLLLLCATLWMQRDRARADAAHAYRLVWGRDLLLDTLLTQLYEARAKLHRPSADDSGEHATGGHDAA